MLRFVAGRVNNVVRSAIVPRATSTAGGQLVRNSSHGVEETDEEFDARYEAYFNRSDIDNWEIRKAMNDLAGEQSFILYSKNKQFYFTILFQAL